MELFPFCTSCSTADITLKIADVPEIEAIFKKLYRSGLFMMFHQVFICEDTKDPDTKDPLSVVEQNNLENGPHLLKQENSNFETNEMGFLHKEDLEMVVEELKSEKHSIGDNKIALKSEPQSYIQPNNLINVLPCGVTSPPVIILPQQQPTSVLQPLTGTGSGYIYQPPVNNMKLEQVVNINGNLVKVIPQVPLQAAPYYIVPTPTPAVISSDLQQNVIMNTKPSYSQNKTDPDEEAGTGENEEPKLQSSLSQNKIDPDEDNNTGDSKVPVLSGAVQSQDPDWIKNCSDKNQASKEEASLSNYLDQPSQTNPKLQNCWENRKNKVSDDHRSMFNIKDCTVVINRTSDYITPNKSPEIHMKDEPLVSIKECEDMSVSDREDSIDHGDDSSGSDWEKEFLVKKANVVPARLKKQSNKNSNSNNDNSSSSKEKIKVPNKNLQCSVQEKNFFPLKTSKQKNGTKIASSTDRNLTNELHSSNRKILPKNFISSIQSTSKNLPKNLTFSSSSGKTYLALPTTLSPIFLNNMIQTSSFMSLERLPSAILLPSTNNTPLTENHVMAKHSLSGKGFTTETLLPHRSMDNTGSETVNTEKYTFQLELPAKTTQSNINLQFIPQNKVANMADTLSNLNTNLQVQTVTFSKIVPSYNHKNVEESQTPAVSKQRINTTPSSATRSNKNELKKTRLKKILPKPKGNAIGSKNGGVLENPPSLNSHEDRISHDNHDDDDDGINDTFSIPFSYYCKPCDKFFECSNQFRCHKKDSLCSGRRRAPKHQCDICGKRFKGLEKLQSHQNGHTNARPHKCSDCDKCFNSKAARYMHHKKDHLNFPKLRYLCCFCAYTTPSIEHLLAHEEEHRVPEGAEVPKPFKCLVCGKGFISRWQQTRHKREHMLKKCRQCPKEFKTDTMLKNHLETEHNITKTYDCKECGMKFRHSGTLRSHKKTVHSTIILYSCDICDKGFKRSNNLRQHMITHSEDRPISCPECGDSFKRNTHLKQHIAAIHGDGRT